jgi:hypothetical protein
MTRHAGIADAAYGNTDPTVRPLPPHVAYVQPPSRLYVQSSTPVKMCLTVTGRPVILTEGKIPPAKPLAPPAPQPRGEHDEGRFARGSFGCASE